MTRRSLRISALALTACALGITPFALASAAGDDATLAASVLQELERDPSHKAITADAVRRGREALERGRRMRAAGDEAHAKLADGLALEWAEFGRDLAKTADLEEGAAVARRDAIDAGAQLERERALLEDGIARTGRLRAEIEAATREGATPVNRTAVEPLDGGAPAAKKPKAATGHSNIGGGR